MINPSLQEQPLDNRATPYVGRRHSSILDWLESEGRLLSRDAEGGESSLTRETDEIFLDDLTESPEEDFLEDEDTLDLDE